MKKEQNQNANVASGRDKQFQKLADATRAAHKSSPFEIVYSGDHDGESVTSIVTGGKKDTCPLFYVTVSLRDFKPSISLGTMNMDEYLTGPDVDALYKEIMAEAQSELVLPARPKKIQGRK